MGEYTANRIRSLLNNRDYINADAERKAKIIKKINDEGRDLAKAEYLRSKGVVE